MIIRRQIPFLGSSSPHAAMLEISQDAMSYPVPLLPFALVRETAGHIIQCLRCSLQEFLAHRLYLESIPTIIASTLPLDTLTNLACNFERPGVLQVLFATLALTHIICMRTNSGWKTPVWHGMSIRSKAGYKCWSSATMPKKRPFANDCSKSVPSTRDPQFQLPRDTLTNKHRLGNTQCRAWEIMLASSRFFATMFGPTRLKRYVALLRLFVHVVLYATKKLFDITKILLLERLTFFQRSYQLFRLLGITERRFCSNLASILDEIFRDT